ncbi:unnamed protein product, partial [Lymnaea stagnalis]
MPAKMCLVILLVGVTLCSGAVLPLTDTPNGGSAANTTATAATTKPPPTTKPPLTTAAKVTTTTKPTTATAKKTNTRKPKTTTTKKTTAKKLLQLISTLKATPKTSTTEPTTKTDIETTYTILEIPTSTLAKFCTYNGKTYAAGETFSPDPCTFCNCEESGQSMCAQMSCPYCPGGTVSIPDQCCPICHPERVLCTFEGEFYAVGASFHTEPCTVCTCGPDGQNECSTDECPYCEGEAVYVDGQCCPACYPTTTTTQQPNFCEANGKYYAVGESYMPDPCQHCTCAEGGHPWCMRYRCEMCDGLTVYVPGQCCPECQQTTPTFCVANGKYYAVGESYMPDPCQHCTCAEGG